MTHPLITLFLAAENDLWFDDRQAFVKCAADPKPQGGGGDRGRGRGRGDRGGGRGRGGDRNSFGGGGKISVTPLSFPFFTFVVIERRERNDAATMFVKNLPYSATKDGIWGLFGNDVKVRHILPT